MHKGFWQWRDRKAGSEVVIHHGYYPSFLNCNFPSFSSAERSLSLPFADSRPLIMNRIHTNCILHFVSPSLGSASFWLCLCSVLLYDGGCGQRRASFHVWLPNSAPIECKNTSKIATTERLLFSNWEWKPDLDVHFICELPCFILRPCSTKAN